MTVDLLSNPDFIRLQALQMQQTKELTEFRILITESMSKLTTQIANWGSTRGETKEPPDPDKTSRELGDQSYLSSVDLDNPKYAQSILDDENYVPAKNVRVTMPKFNGTEVEEWLFQVRRFFIYNKTPEEQKLLMVSFHMEGRARK